MSALQCKMEAQACGREQGPTAARVNSRDAETKLLDYEHLNAPVARAMNARSARAATFCKCLAAARFISLRDRAFFSRPNALISRPK